MLYWPGPTAGKFAAAEIKQMIAENFIEPATVERSAPIVFALSKDRFLCFRVDYRNLAAVTTEDPYTLPILHVLIDSLGEATVFSTLHARSGYWKMKI